MIFRKLREDAIEPKRATQHSAGLDVCSIEEVFIYPGETVMVSTGLTFDLEEYEDTDWFIGLYVRSSLGKRGIMLANGVGVIDADYASNEIKVLLFNSNDNPYSIRKGDRIAQLIVQPHMSDKAKGCTFKYNERQGGFGSSDD